MGVTLPTTSDPAADLRMALVCALALLAIAALYGLGLSWREWRKSRRL